VRDRDRLAAVRRINLRMGCPGNNTDTSMLKQNVWARECGSPGAQGVDKRLQASVHPASQ
jgi:hypothetical protein